ncbi:hypothetical protein D1AOALGA4SA_5072 [Olavius algarvensis Delta 1 endosymbiont]|nr:hypothetical protein D1AOALGA4SA_5072 [Olavius algarvensis Delta 1 endosymbiont]
MKIKLWYSDERPWPYSRNEQWLLIVGFQVSGVRCQCSGRPSYETSMNDECRMSIDE